MRWKPEAHRLGRSLKRFIFSLLPLVFLFLTLETIQRVRYYSRHYDSAWLLYGIVDAGSRRIIKVEKPRFAVPPPRTGIGVTYVVCIGSSTTAGVFNDPPSKYPLLLNQLLTSRAGPDAAVDFHVVNLGLPGATSEAYEPAIEDVLTQITPAVVVFYTGYSDIFVKGVNDDYPVLQAQLGPYWTMMEGRSLLLMTAKEKYLFWKQNQRNSYLQDASKYGRLEAVFRQNIRQTVRLLKAKGTKSVLIPEVLMARRFTGLTGDFSDYAIKYQNIPGILRQVADEEGAELVTLQDGFENDDYKKYFEDPAHLTNAGNHALSRLIFERSKTLQELVSSARK